MADLPTWQYRPRAVRRQREAESLQQLKTAVGPLVKAGDPASMARARAMTNIERRAEQTAEYRARVQARVRESMGVQSSREQAGLPPAAAPRKKKSGGLGGLLGGLKDAAEDVGGGLADIAGGAKDLAGDALGVGAKVGGKGLKAGLTVLDAPREYVGAPAFSVLSGSLAEKRKPILDAHGNPTGRYYRSAPGVGDVGKSLLQAVTSNPIDTYEEARKANDERLADPEMNAFTRTLLQGVQDPLTYLGPGAVKGALRAVPAVKAARAAELARAAAPVGAEIPKLGRGARALNLAGGLLETPKAVSVGSVAGSAIAAQGAENAGLGEKGSVAATLAGGIIGGGLGGHVANRGVRRALKDVDTGLAKVQGREGMPAAIGAGIADTHPDFETYIKSLEDSGVEWTFDRNGRVQLLDPNEASATAEKLATEAFDAWENRPGQWVGGGHRLFAGDGMFTDGQGHRIDMAYGEGRGQGGSGSMPRKQATGGVEANRAMDHAERIWEVLDEGDTDPLKEAMRRPWPVDTRVAAQLPDDTYRLLETSWEDLAKNRAAGEAESKRLAVRLGVERANRYANEHAGPGMSPRGTLRDIAAEIESAELFQSKAKPLKGAAKRLGAGDTRERLMPMVAKSYANRLREIIGGIEEQGATLAGDGTGTGSGAGALLEGHGANAERVGVPGAEGSGAQPAVAEAGAGGAAPTVIQKPGKPDVRVLGERGRGRVVAFDFDLGADVQPGAKVSTPYGTVIVESIGTTDTGATQIRGKFERSNAKHGVLRSDTVLVKQPTGQLDPDGKLAGMLEAPRAAPSGMLAADGQGAGGSGAGEVNSTSGPGRRSGGRPVANDAGTGGAEAAGGVDPTKLTGEELRRYAESQIPDNYDEIFARGFRDRRGEAGAGEGVPPPPKPPAPGAGGLEPDEFSNVNPDQTRVNLEGVSDRPDLEEPEWLRKQFEESVQAEHERAAREVDNIAALGANPADLPFDLPSIEPGLTRMDRAGNAVKRAIGIGVEEDPLATPAMRARRERQVEVNSQAARLGALSQRLVSQAFERDAKGRITSLPNKPTIQDVAAALPMYEPLLTPQQLAVMQQLRREVTPYSNLIREAGIDIDSRPDVAEGGGFYLPRGRAEFEGLDLPAKVPDGRYLGTGTRKGFEKEAVFKTQAEGIDAGFEYPDIGETLQSYGRDAGKRALDQYVSDYFKSLKMEDGSPVAQTYADRIDEQLRSAYQKQVKEVASVRGRLATAERRAGVVAKQTDELDTALMAFTEAAGDAPDLRPLSRYAQQQRRIARRLRRGQPGRRVTVDEKGNVITHDLPFVEGDTIDRVVTAFEDLMPDSLDYADAVDRSIASTAQRLAVLEKRGARWKGEAEALRRQLERADGRLKQLQPEYRQAIQQARKATRGTAQIGFVQLTGRSFPIELANAANKWLQAERPPMGKFAGTTVALDAFNNLMRGIRATGDASFLGIQGLLTAVTDPKAAAKATAVAWKSMADPTALGAYLDDFDVKAAKAGRPTSRDWAKYAAHIGGADTEFAIQAKGLTRLGAKVANLPVAKQANRMFGYYGDVARLELMDTLAEMHLAKGKVLDETAMRQISNAGNLATGWSPNTFGGSVGQLAQFAPRFFQSQLELLANTFAGKGIERSVARKSLIRLLGVSVGLTVLANELSPDGLPIDKVISPFRNPKNPGSGYNPNFLRFRVGGVDTTLLGPWDSLLRGMMETAGGLANEIPGVHSEGSASYLLRTKASPVLSTAWDLMSGEDFLGEKSRTPEYFVRSLLPFSVNDLGMDDLNPAGLAKLGVGLTGVKATPLSPTEDLDRVAQAQYGRDFYDLEPSQQKTVKEDHPELWQRAVERGSAQRKRREALRAELDAQQAASDQNLLSGKTSREDWIAAMKRRRDELAARSKEIYGEGGVGKPKDALDRYFKAIDDATDAGTGEVDWNQVDAWQSAQPEADQAYIDRNTGLNGTPLVQLYRKLTREYYELPRYKGYTADQAFAIDDLYTAVNNLARSDTKLAKASVLKQAARMVGADDATVKAVRRKIYGMLQETTDRAKWKKKHPESSIFLGRGQLLPKDIEAISGAAA